MPRKIEVSWMRNPRGCHAFQMIPSSRGAGATFRDGICVIVSYGDRVSGSLGRPPGGTMRKNSSRGTHPERGRGLGPGTPTPRNPSV